MQFPKPKKQKASESAKRTLGGNKILWSPGDSVFPMSHISKGKITVAIPATAFGLLFTTMPLVKGINFAWNNGFSWGHFFMMTPFFLSGFLILIYGINHFFHRKVLTLRQDEVECDEWGLFGRRHWKENIRKFEGVLKELHYHASGHFRGARTFYKITLQHKTSQKNIPLFFSNNWRHLNDHWKKYAKLFNLPALEKRAQNVVSLPKQELDPPTKKLAKGREVIWIDPPYLNLSKKVTIEIESGGYRITHSRAYQAGLSTVKFLVTLALTTASYFLFSADVHLYPCVALGVLSLFYFLQTLNALTSHEELFISYGGMEHRIHRFWGTLIKTQLPAELINNIQLSKRSKIPLVPSPIKIEAGGETIPFGNGLSEEDKIVVKDFIITVFSHSPAHLQAVA